MKIYQQINAQGFHIGTSAHADWAESKGAIDTDAPDYDRKTHSARWDADDREWIVKTKGEWDEIMNPPEPDTPDDA